MVKIILRYDRQQTMRFAALQSAFGELVRKRHPELVGVDSVVVVFPATAHRPEQVAFRSDATFEIAAYLGGFWRILLVGRVFPRFLRDGIYNLIASYRYRIFGKSDACLLPSPDLRARFIEDE